MPPIRTIAELLEVGEAARPAIRATEGRAPLPYAGLRDLAARTVASLNAIGIGRGDRVAIVLPNGPEMAALTTKPTQVGSSSSMPCACASQAT